MPDGPPQSVSGAFTRATLPEPLPGEPFTLFGEWFDEARAAGDQPNPNAMTLATVDADGKPTARIVLCKGMEPGPGCVHFYTNYTSVKGRSLEVNPHAALVFHWDHTDRQVRIEGVVTPMSAAESDAYFQTRPWQSRLGAWASDQSEPIASREKLLAQVEARAARFGLTAEQVRTGEAEGIEIPRPTHWGGFRLWADRVELWVGGVGRVHDRAEWRRALTNANGEPAWGPWSSTRLQP